MTAWRRASKAIAFPQFRVELAEQVRFRLPMETMLCTLWVRAMTPRWNTARAKLRAALRRWWLSPRARNGTGASSCGRKRTPGARPIGAVATRNAGKPNRTVPTYGNGQGFFEYQFPLREEETRNADPDSRSSRSLISPRWRPADRFLRLSDSVPPAPERRPHLRHASCRIIRTTRKVRSVISATDAEPTVISRTRRSKENCCGKCCRMPDRKRST